MIVWIVKKPHVVSFNDAIVSRETDQFLNEKKKNRFIKFIPKTKVYRGIIFEKVLVFKVLCISVVWLDAQR